MVSTLYWFLLFIDQNKAKVKILTMQVRRRFYSPVAHSPLNNSCRFIGPLPGNNVRWHPIFARICHAGGEPHYKPHASSFLMHIVRNKPGQQLRLTYIRFVGYNITFADTYSWFRNKPRVHFHHRVFHRMKTRPWRPVATVYPLFPAFSHGMAAATSATDFTKFSAFSFPRSEVFFFFGVPL